MDAQFVVDHQSLEPNRLNLGARAANRLVSGIATALDAADLFEIDLGNRIGDEVIDQIGVDVPRVLEVFVVGVLGSRSGPQKYPTLRTSPIGHVSRSMTWLMLQ
jgi:hypothetical protein